MTPPRDVFQVPQEYQGIYTHAVDVLMPTRLLFISGQVGVGPDRAVASDFLGQAQTAMANVEALLTNAGMEVSQIVKVTYLLTRASDLPDLRRIRQQRWSSDQPPAVTVLVVAALAQPSYLVEIEAIAAKRPQLV